LRDTLAIAAALGDEILVDGPVTVVIHPVAVVYGTCIDLVVLFIAVDAETIWSHAIPVAIGIGAGLAKSECGNTLVSIAHLLAAILLGAYICIITAVEATESAGPNPETTGTGHPAIVMV